MKAMSSHSHLFTPLRVGALKLGNRIVIAPMCLGPPADEGRATDWHVIHLGASHCQERRC